MKNLVVIRHAKSSWDDPALTDRERPLNRRGKRDAPLMGGVLKARGLTPDLVLTSPAKRARRTARLIAAELGIPNDRIVPKPELYLQGVPPVLELLTALPDTLNRIYLIGHDPDLSELVNLLTGEETSNLPTCGIASIEFALESWALAGAGLGRLTFFDYPKRHRDTSAPEE